MGGEGEDATIGFLRHAELKHGRVAMAAFVGYCVQSNFVWPWAMTRAGESFPSTDLSPEAQWDAMQENTHHLKTSVTMFTLYSTCMIPSVSSRKCPKRRRTSVLSWKLTTDVLL